VKVYISIIATLVPETYWVMCMPIADRKEVEEKLEIFYREHSNELSKYVAPLMKDAETDVINEMKRVSYLVLDTIYGMYDEEKESLGSAVPIIYKAAPGCIAGAAILFGNSVLSTHGITIGVNPKMNIKRTSKARESAAMRHISGK